MTDTALEQEAPGRLRLRGPVDAETVPGLLRSVRGAFAADDTVEVDLAEVTRTDSAGVALLLDWQQAARTGIRYRNPPAQMRAIVDFCGLSDILAFD